MDITILTFPGMGVGGYFGVLLVPKTKEVIRMIKKSRKRLSHDGMQAREACDVWALITSVTVKSQPRGGSVHIKGEIGEIWRRIPVMSHCCRKE